MWVPPVLKLFTILKHSNLMQNLIISEYTPFEEVQLSTEKPFIVSNTSPMTQSELEREHIIPVFVKDNETVISHQDFINTTQEVVNYVFQRESILSPNLRVSHPIKGRIPEAKNKPAKELLDHERTIYYERMAFIIEIPSISTEVNGNKLSLTVGGVKSYNLDNLYNRKGAEEHFKVFIGFQNKVCTNLCVWSDGFTSNLVARSLPELQKKVYELLSRYKLEKHIGLMESLPNYTLNEHQFATLIGRGKLYQYLPSIEKRLIPDLQFGDNQIGIVAKDYYKDESFCRNHDGSINLWNVFNLFTGANKQSYIDTFLDRGQNAFEFLGKIQSSLETGRTNWFLS